MRNGILIVAEQQNHNDNNHMVLVGSLFEKAKEYGVGAVLHCPHTRIYGYFEGAEADISKVVANIFHHTNYEVIFHLIINELPYSAFEGCYLLNIDKMSQSMKFNAVVLESAIDKYIKNLYTHEDAVDIALFSVKKLKRLISVSQ